MLTPREIARHAPALSGKNLVINGDMQVSQRGNFSIKASTASEYKVDRWYTIRGSGVSGTNYQHKSTDQPTGSIGKSILQEATGASSDSYIGHQYKVEDGEKYAGKTLTFSADVKSNHPEAGLLVYAGTAGFQLHSGEKHTGDGTWQRLEGTVTLPTVDVSELRLQIATRTQDAQGVVVAIGDYVEITNVKIEEGSVATPFVPRSYGEEFSLCRRYYQGLRSLHIQADVASYNTFFYPEHMRNTPTASVSGGSLTLAEIDSITLDRIIVRPTVATVRWTDVLLDAEM